MIQGRSNFVYRKAGTNTFVSLGLKDKYKTTEIHVDVNIVHNDRLDLEAFKNGVPSLPMPSLSWRTGNIYADGLWKR